MGNCIKKTILFTKPHNKFIKYKTQIKGNEEVPLNKNEEDKKDKKEKADTLKKKDRNILL